MLHSQASIPTINTSTSSLTLHHRYTALNQSKLTRAKVASVIRAVARWRNVAELICTADSMDKVERMEDELERLMKELGADVATKKMKKSISPRKRFPPLRRRVLTLSFSSVQTIQRNDRLRGYRRKRTGDVEYVSRVLSES